MQIFISWSGEQSKLVAAALRGWLPKVLAERITPFVSSEDIDAGSRGLDRIASELEESQFGIVVVTPTNASSPWINFEAGALGKSVSSGRVSPLLVGLKNADLDGPLRQFQNSELSDKMAVLKLVKSINKALGEHHLPELALETLFEANWPALRDAVEDAVGRTSRPGPTVRKSEDLLEEILLTVRALQRSSDTGYAVLQERDSKHERRRMKHELAEKSLQLTLLRETGSEDFNISQGLGVDRPGTIKVELGDEFPTISVEALLETRELARRHRTPVHLLRSNGYSVAYDAEGNESRVGFVEHPTQPFPEPDGPNYALAEED